MPFSFKREENTTGTKSSTDEKTSSRETKSEEKNSNTEINGGVLEIAKQYRNWEIDENRGTIRTPTEL